MDHPPTRTGAGWAALALALALAAASLAAATVIALVILGLIPPFLQSAHGEEDAGSIIRDHDRQDAIVSLYVRTRTCMRQAGVAMLRNGVADAFPVQHFMVTTCGDPLRQQMQKDGMDEDTARRYMVALARTSYYDDVLRRPPPTPNN